MTKVVSIDKARKDGLKFYYTGEPCSRGHLCNRYTKKRACVECVREDSFRRSQTKKVKEQNKAYKKTEEYKAKQREYRSLDRVKESESRNQSRRRRENIEEYLHRERLSASKSRDKRKEYSRSHYNDNKEYYREKQRMFAKENPSYFQGKAAERRSRMKSIPWDIELTEFVFFEARDLRAERKKQTGIEWHVDHIVPLNGKTVSGLHVFNNLQVIPAVMNLSKGNKYE